MTFNDSRQGTARMAAKLQQDAERNRVRGLVYHITLQQGKSQAVQKTSQCVEGHPPTRLARQAADAMDRVRMAWMAE